jgi:hypothetical protein
MLRGCDVLVRFLDHQPPTNTKLDTGVDRAANYGRIRRGRNERFSRQNKRVRAALT